MKPDNTEELSKEVTETLVGMTVDYEVAWKDGDQDALAGIRTVTEQRIVQLITTHTAKQKESLEKELHEPVEFAYEGFSGCNNVDPDICACAVHEDPICFYCEKEIEVGAVVLSTQRWVDPFSEDNAGWETFTAHKICPESVLTSSSKEQESKGDQDA